MAQAAGFEQYSLPAYRRTVSNATLPWNSASQVNGAPMSRGAADTSVRATLASLLYNTVMLGINLATR